MPTENSRADALTDAEMNVALEHFDTETLEGIKAFGRWCIAAAFPVEQPAAAPIDAPLRVLMGAVNAYEKETGIGGWYAERIQESCNSLLKAAGSTVRFGLGGENPVEEPARSSAGEGAVHALDCQYILDDNPWAICTCGKGSPNNPRAASASQPVDERAAFGAEWMLVKRERIDEIKRYAYSKFEESYQGRGLYDEDAVRRNANLGEEMLTNIQSELEWIDEDTKDFEAERAASANETAEACRTCGGSRVVDDGGKIS